MGTNSSLASLPLTLKALERLKVSKASSALGACVGTNFNNDGILLYEAMAALVVAQALGLHLSLSAQITVAFLSLIAAMGIAGVPEAGFISLAVVLTTLGLSVEALPLLLTVDWIIARGRSVVNVLSDMVVSLAIDGRKGSLRS
jgi:DAACS family dicarboxylate/amino acid:cation (Na+ or H+) symporter